VLFCIGYQNSIDDFEKRFYQRKVLVKRVRSAMEILKELTFIKWKKLVIVEFGRFGRSKNAN
jgi:hypothetical protein